MSNFFLGRYFKIYCNFFNSDIEASVVSDRNFEIINAFFISLDVLINNDISTENTKEYLNNLHKIVEIENEMYSNLKIYDCDSINTLQRTKKIQAIFEITINNFIIFSEAYQMVHNAFNSTIDSNEIDYRIFQDLLVEFNNALSHILTAIVSDSVEVIGSNTKRANTHLLRGTLDSYKEVIGLNSELVLNSTKSYYNLGNKSLYEYYLSLREMEATSIGIVEQNITIIQEYEKFCKIIINQ